MWTREEVLEKYQLRNHKEWKEKGLHKAEENVYYGEYYPWTPACEHYLPKYERNRLRKKWMHTYAKLSNLRKLLLKWLFTRWIIGTYKTHPKMNKKNQYTRSIDTELERLLQRYNETFDKLSAREPNMSKQYAHKSDYYNSMAKSFSDSVEDDLMKDEIYEPFQMCMLITMDRDGNTKQTSFLKAALRKFDPKLLKHLRNTGEENSENLENNCRLTEESNPIFCMLTSEEKTDEQMRSYCDRVWELAIQNWDYIQRSKAL
ncbi:hypothetical protein Y032_0041g376 [Ancylostoma ceylanicum]|nr:hypothetical protein Y032_0041g376 [Ancylostoma ceylanicum]